MFQRIRAAWRALFRSSASSTAMVADVAQPAVNPRQRWEHLTHGTPIVAPASMVLRADPMPGVVPSGFAMDDLPAVPNSAANAYSMMFHEGIGFLGYPYLAELSQRAEYRHVCSTWAEHCVRKWIKFTGDDERIARIEQEFDRLNVRELFQEAIELECIFGRMQIFMDFGDFDKPNELPAPLIIKPGKIKPGRPLKRLKTVEPMWSYPGIYDGINALAPDFYKPSQWFVMGQDVHASRLLTLVSRGVPNMLKPAYAFGGVSLAQMCKPYVDNWLRARQSVSDLMHSFSVMVLKTDMESRISNNELISRVQAFTQFRDNRGTFVIDKESEDFANVSAPIAGLDKLQAQALEQIAAVSGIPLVVLLGQTPTGLNASSEGEIRVFYDKIMAYNEKVCGPAIRTLLDVVQLSLFEDIDQDIGFKFVSLWEMSDKDKADIRKSDAEADAVYINAGVVSPEETRTRLNDEEEGLYGGMLKGPAPDLPEMDDPLDGEA